jgi:hypothetical protein
VEVGTLVIAIAGVLLGGASLGWQVVSWQKSGPVVKVFVHPSPLYVRAENGDMQPRPDLGRVLTLNATNSGRTAARIDTWGYQLENATTGVKYQLTFGDPSKLPAHLPALERVEFPLDRSILINGMNERQMLTARGFVQLATGEQVPAPTDAVMLPEVIDPDGAPTP